MVTNVIQSLLFKFKNGPLKPFRFKVIKKMTGKKPIKILDVGCGNESFYLANKFLTIRDYVGIDKVDYDGEDGYSLIPNLVYADLDSDLDKLESLEEDFDLIIMSHIIEHTNKFESYIKILLKKLNTNGLIYIETPHPRTLNYPSAIGFLNFYDDDTHVRCFNEKEVLGILRKNNMNIDKSGVRRDIFRLVFISPIVIFLNIIYFIPIKRKLLSAGLWDLLGVAFYVIATKQKN